MDISLTPTYKVLNSFDLDIPIRGRYVVSKFDRLENLIDVSDLPLCMLLNKKRKGGKKKEFRFWLRTKDSISVAAWQNLLIRQLYYRWWLSWGENLIRPTSKTF